MFRRTRTLLLMTGLLLIVGSAAHAQNAPAAPPRPAVQETKPAVRLKILVLLSQLEGERKISSMPFTLLVNAGYAATTQMNIQVAVPAGSPAMPGVGSFNYKSIGHMLSAMTKALDDGRFDVQLRIEDSSILPDKATTPSSAVPGTPSFPSFTWNNTLAMRDGETLQFASVPNALTGQVTKIDVTLNILK